MLVFNYMGLFILIKLSFASFSFNACNKTIDLNNVIINGISAVASQSQVIEAFGSPDTIFEYSFSNYKYWNYSAMKMEWMQIDSSTLKLSYINFDLIDNKIKIIDKKNEFTIDKDCNISDFLKLVGKYNHEYRKVLDSKSIYTIEEIIYIKAILGKNQSQLRFSFKNSKLTSVSIPFP